MSLLEHFFLCDLYTKNDYKGLVFNSSLRLEHEFETLENNSTTYRAKTHIVEAVNSNSYFLDALRKLNAVINIFTMFASCESLSDEIKQILSCTNETLDNDEQKVIHNLMNKILKDKNKLPKALVMKFVICVFLAEEKSKSDIKKFYGVFCLSTLFNIFENDKGKEIFSSILKSSNDNWHIELIKKLKDRYISSKHTQARLFSAIKQPKDKNDGDYQHRCKSLAVIYNYFKIEDSVIVCKPIDKVMKYLTNSDMFSTEHLIISKSDKLKIHDAITYHLPPEIKKYQDKIFNFIFIPKSTNDECGNYWLPEKMSILKLKEIDCEYSKMIIDHLNQLSDDMTSALGDDFGNTRTKLDSFFLRDFKDAYLDYARTALAKIMNKLVTNNGVTE